MTRRQLGVAGGLGLVIAAFLLTRMAFLDRDLPPWTLAQYQPIDEFAYTIPALNLHHYGTWTHQEVPYVPLEGSPMNILESLVTAGTLTLGWSYWGLRASSVLFALVAFGAMLGTASTLVGRARRDGVSLPFDPRFVLAAAIALLLTDFSFLMSGRVVEATGPRLAVIALLVLLVARGTFLGGSRSLVRSFGFGIITGSAVLFVYVYNAFLIPGAILAVALWAWHGGSWGDVLRHVGAASVGVTVSIVAYFAIVAIVYGQGPLDWYDTWLSTFRETGRATGFDPAGGWDVLAGNIFRLDRPFMALALVALPAFVQWTRRTWSATGIVSLSLLLAFLVQCTIQSDYPQRKILVVLALTLPIAVGGVLRLGEWRTSLSASPRRTWAGAAWIILCVCGAVVLTLPPQWTHWSTLVRLLGIPPQWVVQYRVGTAGFLIAGGALVGIGCIVLLVAAWRRPAVARIAAVGLVGAMLLPMLYLDRAYVFSRATTTYRDAMIAAGSAVDGQVTAGDLSFAMQLYNSGRPVLEGYVFGMSNAEYEAALVRFFREGRATSMFAYADTVRAARWMALGFRLVETYSIDLPNGAVIGRFVFEPAMAPGS